MHIHCYFNLLEDARVEGSGHSRCLRGRMPVHLPVVAHQDALPWSHVALELAAEGVDRHLDVVA